MIFSNSSLASDSHFSLDSPSCAWINFAQYRSTRAVFVLVLAVREQEMVEDWMNAWIDDSLSDSMNHESHHLTTDSSYALFQNPLYRRGINVTSNFQMQSNNTNGLSFVEMLVSCGWKTNIMIGAVDENLYNAIRMANYVASRITSQRKVHVEVAHSWYELGLRIRRVQLDWDKNKKMVVVGGGRDAAQKISQVMRVAPRVDVEYFPRIEKEEAELFKTLYEVHEAVYGVVGA